MNIDDFLNSSYEKLSDMIQYKLLKDYEDERISLDEYRKISRGLSSVFNYLEVETTIKNGRF